VVVVAALEKNTACCIEKIYKQDYFKDKCNTTKQNNPSQTLSDLNREVLDPRAD
jgi:hypothetical protein